MLRLGALPILEMPLAGNVVRSNGEAAAQAGSGEPTFEHAIVRTAHWAVYKRSKGYASTGILHEPQTAPVLPSVCRDLAA